MKISLKWLNSCLTTPVAADDVEPLLTGHGFPIEDREDLAGGDVMFDVEVTSNRGDVLSHVGTAREIAAAIPDRTALKAPDAALPAEAGADVNTAAAVRVDDAGRCPLYTARVIRGVKVGPSPDWLVARLEAVGLRPINNVVDVTNYVMLERGQPLHAFDLARLSGSVVVRSAAAGEAFAALDGTTHKLSEGALVIADDAGPQALAGVMGGATSGVTETTVDVLLESGIFDPLAVRASSRGYKIGTDSSFRFERGVDPRGVDVASRRAAALIAELTGGTVAQGVIRAGGEDPDAAPQRLRVRRTQALLGIALGADEQAGYLGRLGLSPRIDGDVIEVQVPTFRLDLTREVDLIEEIARLHGMDAIPVNEAIELTARAPQTAVKAHRRLTDVLVARGFHETITFSFTRPAWAAAFMEDGAQPVTLSGDHKKDEPALRPSVLPSLLACRKVNQDAGNHGVRLFEWASTWRPGDEQAVETRRLACTMDAEPGAAGLDAAIRTLRGTLDDLVTAVGGAAAAGWLTVDALPDSGAEAFAAAGVIKLQGQTLGTLGAVSAPTLKRFGVTVPQVAMELNAAALRALFPPRSGLTALPKYPAIERDLSVEVDEQVAWRDIARGVDSALPELMESFSLQDVYRGKGVAKGRKSVSFRLCFRDPEATLRHEQVDPQVASVVASLKQAVGAELRG